MVDRVDDRDERRMFNSIIQELAEKTYVFAGKNERLQSKLGRPYYSSLCVDQKGEFSYREVEKLKQLKPMLGQMINDYNL